MPEQRGAREPDGWAAQELGLNLAELSYMKQRYLKELPRNRALPLATNHRSSEHHS